MTRGGVCDYTILTTTRKRWLTRSSGVGCDYEELVSQYFTRRKRGEDGVIGCKG